MGSVTKREKYGLILLATLLLSVVSIIAYREMILYDCRDEMSDEPLVDIFMDASGSGTDSVELSGERVLISDKPKTGRNKKSVGENSGNRLRPSFRDPLSQPIN